MCFLLNYLYSEGIYVPNPISIVDMEKTQNEIKTDICGGLSLMIKEQSNVFVFYNLVKPLRLAAGQPQRRASIQFLLLSGQSNA